MSLERKKYSTVLRRSNMTEEGAFNIVLLYLIVVISDLQ